MMQIRFHNLCSSIIETLMNRLQSQHDQDWDTCVLWGEEDKLLRTIGLSCD